MSNKVERVTLFCYLRIWSVVAVNWLLFHAENQFAESPENCCKLSHLTQ